MPCRMDLMEFVARPAEVLRMGLYLLVEDQEGLAQGLAIVRQVKTERLSAVAHMERAGILAEQGRPWMWVCRKDFRL